MKNKAKFSRSLRQGGYLAGVTAGVLAVVVLVNLMMGQLPSNWKEFDLTDNSCMRLPTPPRTSSPAWSRTYRS